METHHTVRFQSADALSYLAPDSIDLVVTSPPYPMIEIWDAIFGAQNPAVTNALEAGNGVAAHELMHRLLDAVWRECYRVLRPGGFACINIGDATRTVGDGFRLYTNHTRVTFAFESLGFESLPTVLWRKQTNAPNKFMGSGMLPSGAYVTLEHEHILIFRKGGRRTFSDRDKERRQRSAFFWEERNAWFSDVWDLKGTRQTLTENGSRHRSGAFPFEIVFRLINMYSMQEDVVLDPFLGTGTTSAAALVAGRSSHGVEIDRMLLPTIEETLACPIRDLNRRQIQRVSDHEAFVAAAHNGRTLEYHNDALGIPVMTRQEIHLMIPTVTNIEKVDPGVYKASHSAFGRSKKPSLPVGTLE
ncbi:MAG: site-specific DNA-methyltransferase [Spirochaetales bacterium]|nr:site-specific DNA-methyltransferase [Spirochaetales bacterium]